MMRSKSTLLILGVISLLIGGLVIEDGRGNLNASAAGPQKKKLKRPAAIAGGVGSAETEPNDCPETANPISTAGCAISGQIAANTDVDFYSFVAPAGARVWAYVDTGDIGAPSTGTSRDSVLTLFGPCVEKAGPSSPAGQCSSCVDPIEVDNNDGTGNGGDGTIESNDASAIAGASLGVSGTYYLRVEESGNDGTIIPYQLFVVVTTASPTPEVEPNDTLATANEVFSEGQTSGIVAGSGNSTDFYKVCLAEGDILFVSLDGDPAGDGGADHSLTLIAPDESTVLFGTNSSDATGDPAPPAEAFSFNISVAGTYFIQALPITPEPNEYNLMASRCGAGTPACACTLQCPPNITQSNDPNQCGAVVIFAAPTSTGDCGTVTCSPASGSFFPVGTTTITCTAEAGATCLFTVTIVDTQPPSITCPANVTAVAAQTCPISSSAAVTFPPPAASDNCPGVVTSCNPPSGSIFPVGTTTVTCTATDASGNTATCSFTLTVFSGCLQDDSNPANVVLFNSFTGEYQFCCGGTVFAGTGTVLVKGCIVTIQHNPPNRRVLIKFDGAVSKGTASLQFPPGTVKCTIADRDTRNNTCVCVSVT